MMRIKGRFGRGIGVVWPGSSAGRAVGGLGAVLALSLFALAAAPAESKTATGVIVRYAKDKGVCDSVATYLNRIDNRFLRRSVKERRSLLDPFGARYAPLLPTGLAIPTPIEIDDPGWDPRWTPDGAPHFLFYSLVINQETKERQIIAIHDIPIGSYGDFISHLYILKPGKTIDDPYKNFDVLPDDIENSIGNLTHINTEKQFNNLKLPYNEYTSYAGLMRIFTKNENIFVIVGSGVFPPGGVVFRILPDSAFDHECDLQYVPHSVGH